MNVGCLSDKHFTCSKRFGPVGVHGGARPQDPGAPTAHGRSLQEHRGTCVDPSLAPGRGTECGPGQALGGTSPAGVLAGSVDQQSNPNSAQKVARSTGKSRGPHIELKRVPAPRSCGTAWPCHFGGGYKASGPTRPDSAEMVPGDCEAGLPLHTAGHRPGLPWGLEVPVLGGREQSPQRAPDPILQGCATLFPGGRMPGRPGGPGVLCSQSCPQRG